MPSYSEINNCKLSCPQPVINTKAALEEIHQQSPRGFTLVSIVDNESAAENVTRFARRAGYNVEVEKKEAEIHVCIFHDPADNEEEENPATARTKAVEEKEVPAKEEGSLLLITSSAFGTGSEELGQLLMRNYLYALNESFEIPSRIIFINSGVYLTVSDSPALEQLKEMENKGVEIYSCGTCLDYFGLEEKLAVGTITNMYDVAEYMGQALRCLTI